MLSALSGAKNVLDMILTLKELSFWGTWVAQLVESDFGSGHDLVVREFELRVKVSAVSIEPASDPLSPIFLPLHLISQK